MNEKKVLEAEGTYLRRQTVLEQEFEMIRAQIEERKRTALSRGRSQRVIELFDHQLRKQEVRYRQRLVQLDNNRNISVSLSEPIALCVVEVRRA